MTSYYREITANPKSPSLVVVYPFKSNISQILLSHDDRKPSAQKDPPLRDTSVKKKNSNLGKAMKALLMKKFPYTRAIKTTFLVKFKGLSLSDLHQNKHSSALIKLQTKSINSGPTVTQRHLNWITKFMVPILVSIHFQYKTYKEELAAFQKKAKSVASSKGDRPQDFVEYDITTGDTFLCPKCDHIMVMQLDTTETIAVYNHKVDDGHEDKMRLFNWLAASIQECWPKPRRTKYKERRRVKFLNPGGEGCSCWICNCLCNVVFTESTWPDIACGVDPKELGGDTAPNTMPGLVSMIRDTIPEATCAEFLEDTTASKQDITCNACSSVFFQIASNPHLGSAKFQKTIKEAMGPIKKPTSNGKNIDQLRAEHKGKTAQPRILMVTPSAMAPANEIQQTPKYVRDVKMEAINRSCKENTTPETCNVLGLMAENLTNQEDSKAMVFSKVQILQALQAKLKSQQIAPTDPADPNPSVPSVDPYPSVPPSAWSLSPSQQEDDSSDLGFESSTEYDKRDDPTNPGWDRLLSLHGIDRKRIPDSIIWPLPKMYYLPHPKEEVNLKREHDYQEAIQRCQDEIRHQDEDSEEIDPDGPKWDSLFAANGIAGTKRKREPEPIIPRQEDQEITYSISPYFGWYVGRGRMSNHVGTTLPITVS
eukprot:jgi/Psemu1/22303/gm1.22303_g